MRSCTRFISSDRVNFLICSEIIQTVTLVYSFPAAFIYLNSLYTLYLILHF